VAVVRHFDVRGAQGAGYAKRLLNICEPFCFAAAKRANKPRQ
jgi:hypothetical protein